MLRQTNATVTVVAASTASQGQRDDWDAPTSEPSGAGAVKWSGSERVYLSDRARRQAGADGSTVVRERALVTRSAWARESGVDTDDSITVTLDSGGTIQVYPRDVAVSELPTASEYLQTARITLR